MIIDAVKGILDNWPFQLIGLLFLLTGTMFSALGIIGLVRLPDVYSRLHATGKVSSFGAVFMVLAAIILIPVNPFKGLVLIGLILLASPTVSHAIASAAYRYGIRPKNLGIDELGDKERKDIETRKE